MTPTLRPWAFGDDGRRLPPPLIALDPQHINKPSHPLDRGAAFDIDGDGVVRREEHEVDLVLQYVGATRRLLEHNRIPVIDGFSGAYSARNRHADDVGAGLYLACHMNAGGGSYGLVGVDHRSRAGSPARQVAQQLQVAWGELLGIEVQIIELTPTGNRAQRNGFATIRRRRGPALLLEPLFMDGHASLLVPSRRPSTIGLIAKGIDLSVRRSMTLGAL